MADYIDREKTEEAIQSLTIVDATVAAYAEAVLFILRRQPSADVAPVVHARWVDDHFTACGYGVNPWNNTPHCPRCGAKMKNGC